VFYYASKIVWFFTTPSNLLPSFTLLGLTLMVTKRTRRLGGFLAAASTLILLAAGLLPIANWIILPLEQRFPAYRHDRAVTGIIVLGGSVLAEDSFAREQLSVNEAAERVFALAELARRYPGAKVVFSGGGGTLFADEKAEAAALVRFSESLGISPGRIVVEDRSRTTRENALYTRQLIQPQAGEQWLLVTSAWHMPRSVGVFRAAGFPVTAYPVDFRTRGPQDRWRTFTFASEGLRRLDIAAKEWAGLVGYWLAGYTSELLPGPT